MLMVLKLTITRAPSTIGSTSLTWIDCCIPLIIALIIASPLSGASMPQGAGRCVSRALHNRRRRARLGYSATLVGIGRQFEGADGLAQCVGTFKLSANTDERS